MVRYSNDGSGRNKEAHGIAGYKKSGTGIHQKATSSKDTTIEYIIYGLAIAVLFPCVIAALIQATQ